jgi:hypothetical protein
MLQKADGTRVTKGTANTVYTTVPVTDPDVQISTDLYEMRRPDGTANPPQARWLRFHAGQIVSRSQLLAFFPDAVIEQVVPTGGPAAGGTAVTIRGENFAPAATVKFGANAATNVKVIDEKTITCTAPAGAAGAVPVVVTTDAGDSPVPVTFTYA